MKKTIRGFPVYKGPYKTKWHGDMWVQASSAAFVGPCCWVFTSLDYSNTPEVNPPVLHLTLKDATRLRDGLTAFIEESKSK